MEKNPILNVTDLSSYLYCPRKFYINKVLGLREPANKQMIEGRIRHEILEKFFNHEKRIVESFKIPSSKKQIIKKFQELLENLMDIIFAKNQEQINDFSISKKELRDKINSSMEKEISLRAESIEQTIERGFLGESLWENLSPKYLSELPLYSENLGLKGRADRVLISEEGIIPFELKTREIEKIWPSDEIQITAYAMLLEEKHNKQIPLGIIEAGNKKHEIKITIETKKKVTDLIKEIRQVLDDSIKEQKNNVKYPPSFSKCQSCPWEETCKEI